MGAEYSCCVSADTPRRTSWLITNNHMNSPPRCLFQQCTAACVTHMCRSSAMSFCNSELTLQVIIDPSSPPLHPDSVESFGAALRSATSHYRTCLTSIDLSLQQLTPWDIQTMVSSLAAIANTTSASKCCISSLILDGQRSFRTEDYHGLVAALSLVHGALTANHVSISAKGTGILPQSATRVHWVSLELSEQCRWSQAAAGPSTSWRQSSSRSSDRDAGADNQSPHRVASPEPRMTGYAHKSVRSPVAVIDDCADLYRERSAEPTATIPISSEIGVPIPAATANCLPSDTEVQPLNAVTTGPRAPALTSPNPTADAITCLQALTANAFCLSERAARSILEWHLELGYWDSCLDLVGGMASTSGLFDEAVGPLQGRTAAFRRHSLQGLTAHAQAWLHVAFSLVELAERIVDGVAEDGKESKVFISQLRAGPLSPTSVKPVIDLIDVKPLSLGQLSLGLEHVSKCLVTFLALDVPNGYLSPFSEAMTLSIKAILEHVASLDSKPDRSLSPESDAHDTDEESEHQPPVNQASSRFPHYMKRLSPAAEVATTTGAPQQRVTSPPRQSHSNLPAVPLSLSQRDRSPSTPATGAPNGASVRQSNDLPAVESMKIAVQTVTVRTQQAKKLEQSPQTVETVPAPTLRSAVPPMQPVADEKRTRSPASPRMTVAAQARLDNLKLQQERERKAAQPIENKAFASITAKVSTRRASSGDQDTIAPRTLTPTHIPIDEWKATHKRRSGVGIRNQSPNKFSSAPSHVAMLRAGHQKHVGVECDIYNFARSKSIEPCPHPAKAICDQPTALSNSRLESEFAKLTVYHKELVSRSTSVSDPPPEPCARAAPLPVKPLVKASSGHPHSVPAGLSSLLFPMNEPLPLPQPLGVVSPAILSCITNCASNAALERNNARKANPAAYFSIKPKELPL